MKMTYQNEHQLKDKSLMTAKRNGVKRIPARIGFVLAVTFLHLNADAQDTIYLGMAGNFEVMAGSTVTSTGATVINGGNLGLAPGSSITGFPAGTVVAPYMMEVDNSAVQQADVNLNAAYNQASSLTPTENLTGQNLGGLTLTPGVYSFSSSAALTGILTLNDEGNPNAQFVFQIGSSLVTASGSSVRTINGGSSLGNDVFWQVGSSATIGTGSAFEGNILARTSITADTGASFMNGRLLAMNGAVTLDDNSLNDAAIATVPENSTFVLFGGGLSALVAFRRRFSVLA